jgi:hypothetical protein
MNNSDKPFSRCPPKTLWGEEDKLITFSRDGLTKREYFAGLAMQGLLSNDLPVRGVAKCALEYADALLGELEKCEK